MPEKNDNRLRMTRTETVTALVHYYRAEVVRSLAWRERMDRTTNWAVGTTAAFIGFGFSHPELTHAFFLFAVAVTYILLWVESRRYRFFDAYEYRVRLLHKTFVRDVLLGTMTIDDITSWRKELARDLLYPEYKISVLQSVGRRIYANYIYLFLVLFAAWLLRIKLYPEPAVGWRAFVENARVDVIPGQVTLAFIFLFLVHLFALMHLGRRARPGQDVIRRRHGDITN